MQRTGVRVLERTPGDTKTEGDEEVVLRGPVTIGAAHAPWVILIIGTTAQDPIPNRVEILAAIIRLIGVTKAWFVRFVSPQTAAPFPNIAGHIGTAVRTVAGR